jgi:hypothetical protein
MRRTLSVVAIVLATISTTAVVAPVSSAFEFEDLDMTFNGASGELVSQAGSHPFSMTTTVNLASRNDPSLGEIPDGAIKDLNVDLPEGFVGSPGAVPTCSTADFVDVVEFRAACRDSAAVGVATLKIGFSGPGFTSVPLYNLAAPPGMAAKLGFVALAVPVTIELGVNESPPYNVVATVPNVSQVAYFYGSEVTVWGNPSSSAHDPYRGRCVDVMDSSPGVGSLGKCPVSTPEKPFVTMPRACLGPLTTNFEADSWEAPGSWIVDSAITHGSGTPPPAEGMNGCDKVGFSPSITAKPTTRAAQSPTGLDFSLDVEDEGLTNPDEQAVAKSDIRRAEVTLPEGFTTNPSIAEGLSVCSEADLTRETASSDAGQGCPNASKVGTVEVETPLLEESVDGSLYIAKPFENPFGSLLALYLVIKNPQLGIVIRQPLEVRPDPRTGRLTTIADELPQLPFSHFRLHFREGARSPLASPPLCGTYNAEATLTPWSGGPPVRRTSAFQITSGPNGSTCPSESLPFQPGQSAGTLSNAAGSYSPFNVRLTRNDGEQEISRFSIKLPPGLTGKLAGIPFCTDAAIEAAKSKTGTAEELNPSCPAASQVGRTLVGAGVGPSLAYAPGKLYLAGPYHGSPLSIAAVTAAKVGPFDLGTVVVRAAFKIDPETAEVSVDSAGSDPIPHIIDGVPIHARDIRIYTDRPRFVLNPTSCAPTTTLTTVMGSGLDFGTEADDQPATVATPFQAADCAALDFKPKLSLKLLGGTQRGDHPKLKATLRMRGSGESNIAFAQVALPRSEFIENSHFNTICTRVQFRQRACPPGSIYGKARAVTPLLDDPLEGPVFLRSSDHQLPDLVVELENREIRIDLVGHIDSVKGRIRNTFEVVPDAPVQTFTLEMLGGKKGLFVNSANLCRNKHRALTKFRAHNGRVKNFRPVLVARCGKGGKRAHGGSRSTR